MNRMSRLNLMMLFVIAVVSGPNMVPVAADESPAGTPSIADLVADLDSDQYAVRKRATRQLIAAGSKSVPALAAAVENGGLEVRTRVLRILREFYSTENDDTTDEDDATIEAAEIALENLTESDNLVLAADAERVLNSFYERREQRALVQIEKLGGVISYRELTDPRFNRVIVNSNKKQIAYILLGTKWKGGDRGLKYVKRLSNLGVLYLSGTGEQAPISKEAEQSLASALPNLMIQRRGAAYLGIGGGPHQRGCQIVQVKEGAAAARAGLRQFDVITGFGDKKIPDFDTLITHIKTYSPGDKVKVTVLRGAEELTLNVVMGEWK